MKPDPSDQEIENYVNAAFDNQQEQELAQMQEYPEFEHCSTGLPDVLGETIYSTTGLCREATTFGFQHIAIDSKQKELKKFLV